MAKRKVVDFRVSSKIDTPDWQGHGTAFTHYTDCATGNAGTLREALDDALESLAQDDIEVSEEQETDMLAQIGPGLDVTLPIHCPKCGNADCVTDELPDAVETWSDNAGSDYACTSCQITFDSDDTSEQYYYVSVDVTTDAGE